MTKERWTDERLDDVIDDSARRMTEDVPQYGLAARIGARLERRRPPMALAWQLASAAAIVALAVFVIARWPGPVQQQAMAPIITPRQPVVTPAPRTTVAASPQQNPVLRGRHRPPQTILIERDSTDIPALEAPAPLSVDAAPVAQLQIAPLDVKELSVPPLDTERDGKR